MSKYGEPWHVGRCLPDRILDAKEEGVGWGFVSRELASRAVACVNALAGLEPGDVATLVELVRRYLLYHDGVVRVGTHEERDTCECSVCSDARALIARLPK